MAAPPELALEEQASSRKAAGATRVDDAVGWPPGWVWREQRVAPESSPSEGLGPHFPGAQLSREDGQPGIRSPGLGGSPRAWGDVTGRRCSGYLETIVSAGLPVPGVGVGGGIESCRK